MSVEQADIASTFKLQLSVRACNDTGVPSAIMPTLLEFGVVSQISLHTAQLSSLQTIMAALHEIQKHMARLKAKERIAAAVQKKVPTAAHQEILIGDFILVHSGHPKSWVG